MEPLRASLPTAPVADGDGPRAREEVTPPTQSDRVVGDVAVRVDGEERDSPAPFSEVRELVLRLRSSHGGSPTVVYRWAGQMPRAEFLAVYRSVLESQESGSARQPVAILVSQLQIVVEAAYASASVVDAATAAARFGYGEVSAIERLRADPEQWIRRVGTHVSADEVEAYLRAHVADELDRRRLLRILSEEQSPEASRVGGPA